ncbi:MAG: PPC domain-containing protein [Cyanobacteria bacterium J06639_16]
MNNNCLLLSSVSTAIFGCLAFLPLQVFAQSQGSNVILNEQGSLERGDDVLSDGSLYDAYTFSGQAGQQVTITLESQEFDTYLILVDSDGNSIAQNDDINSNNRNSSINVALPASGVYNVVANAYDSSGRGRYTLTVSGGDSTNSSTSNSSAIAEARPGFELYRYRNLFSIEYPQGWIVEDPSGSGNIFIWNRRPSSGGGSWPSNLVKTDVIFFPESFDAAPSSYFGNGGSVITRRGSITIGGRRALRIWADGMEGPGIHTFIEYTNDTTVILSSYYGSDIYIDEIQDIHWSFRLLN